MTNAGIDYGLGSTNIDRETGIRFGVISQGSVLQAWADSAEPDYGEACCPKCGNKAQSTVLEGGASFDYDLDDFEQAKGECADFVCEYCEYVFGSESAYGDEPAGWNYDGDGYQLTDCLDSDIFVLKSPFYTFAQFCSPCVPGAGNLDSTDADGVKTYCLGHDWFEDGKAPYPLYRVADNSLVESESQ